MSYLCFNDKDCELIKLDFTSGPLLIVTENSGTRNEKNYLFALSWDQWEYLKKTFQQTEQP